MWSNVPHQKLILKLIIRGISGSLLTWIGFLPGCTVGDKKVQISGAKSEWITIASGVPQGSVLDPKC